MTPKSVGLKPNDAELMTMTCVQKPSEILFVALITEFREPARSGGKHPPQIQDRVVESLSSCSSIF